MSKPLELIVYPLWTSGLEGTVYCSAFHHQGYPRPVDIDVLAKRFTDAELAAEWHANETEAWRMVGYRPQFYDVDRAELLEDRAMTLRRFATLPHYDEVEA